MDCEINLSKFKDTIDNIIRTEENNCENTLKLYCKNNLDKKEIMRTIRYLNSTGWRNFKFNEYSVKQRESDYVVTFGYVRPTVFAK